MVMVEDYKREPIVFVLEQGPFDYSPARVFSRDIRPLSIDKMTPNAEPSWHAKVIQQMRSQLADYIPGVDFVIPTGRPVQMMLAAMVMHEHGTHHKLLGWDDRTQRYFLYELQL